MIKLSHYVTFLSVLLLISITSVSVADAQTPTVPDAPIIIDTAIGDELVELVWTGPFNGGAPIDHYTIEYGIDGVNWFELDIFSPDTTGIVVDLVNGQEYQFRVSATNTVGLTGFPSDIVFATPLTIPDEPRNLTAIPDSASVTLFWEAPFFNGGSPVTSYVAEWSLDNFASILGSLVIDPTDIQTDILGLTPNIPHDFRISAVNIAGVSPPSNVFTVIPDNVLPTTLSLVKQSIGGTGTFEIQNTNSTGTQSHFVTTFSNFPTSSSPILIVPGDLQSLTEIVPSGWIQTGEFCSVNGVDIPGNVTSFTPAAGDDVVCKFTNVDESTPAKLTIQKNSGDFTGAFDFTIQNSTKTILTSITTTEINSENVGTAGPLFLDPDTYSVSETVLTNWNLDGAECKNNGVSISPLTNLALTSGADVLCIFDNTRTDATGEIHGLKLQDGVPLAGVKINATNIDKTVTRATVTDSNGEYWFMNLIPDTYTVNEILPDFSVQVFPVNNQPHTVSVGFGEIITGIDFENTLVGPSEIHGTVFTDSGTIGVFELTDVVLQNQSVQLFQYDSGGNTSFVGFTQTDVNGMYSFTSLEPGIYEVRSFAPFSPSATSVPLNNEISFVTLSGQVVNDLNIGFTPTVGVITGTAFLDLNENGIFDVGELPAAFNQICASPGSTCTNSNNLGEYTLNLPAGSYGVFAGDFTNTGNPSFTVINVPSLSFGETIIGVDVPYLDLIPLPGDMGIPTSNGENGAGTPTIVPSRPLEIIKDITVCSPIGSPLVTLTDPADNNSVISTQFMQNVPDTTIWTADFGTNLTRNGDTVNIRVDIDCPFDTIGYPEDITLFDPANDAFQIGDVVFVDPSGQILNQCTDEPINGATATLRVASPTGTTNFVVPQPNTHLPSDNPQITDDAGQYAWLVTPGDYIVTASKIGFESNTSPIVNIPPPVTGLDIFLTPVDGCDVPLTLEEINQIIADLKAEKQQLKDDAQIQRDSIKAQIQLLKDEKQQINGDTRAQKDTINAQISQLREDRKNTNDPAEKLIISEQIAALHDQKRQLTFDAHNAKFALNQQIMDLQAQKRQLNLDTFLAQKTINDEIAELQKLKRDLNDNTSQEKKDISNQIADLQQEKRDINEQLKLDNDALGDEISLLQSDKKDTNHQLRTDIKDIGDQISLLKSDKRNATTTLEKQIIQDEIDILKDQRTQLRDLAKQEILSIKSQTELLKDQKQQNKDDANAQKDMLNQQIDVLKELRSNL